MVRLVGRSKGCEACRKRKVKCDEKRPSCSQCLRGRRKCPGPVDGNIFLLVDPGNPLRTDRVVELQMTPPVYTATIRTPPCSHNSSDQVNVGNAIVRAINPRILATPAAVRLIQEQLVSFFVSFFAKSAVNQIKPYGWMSLLPFMLSDKSRAELRFSVLAAAFVLHSELAQDVDFEVEARRWYGYGLKHQRLNVLRVSRHSEEITPSVEDVVAAVMLAYYEVISSTSPVGYFYHILGAKALLESLGPQKCQLGYLHQLFQTVRLHMVFISITTKTPTVFGSEDWSTVPFATEPRSTRGDLIGILLRLPQVLQQPIGDSSDDMTIQLITELKDIWAKLEDDLGATPTYTSKRSVRMTINGMDQWYYVPQSSVVFSRSETAITAAFYCLAWIIIIVETRKGTQDEEVHDQLIPAHCDIILKAAMHIDEFEDGCGYIRMVLPLRLVVLYSPDSKQRESARYRLERWRTNRGLGGICRVALATETEISNCFNYYRDS